MGGLRLARNLERIMSSSSLQGHFLIASPLLPDPNFARTVVLMVEHGSKGTWGLVLNRPSGNRVSDVWQLVEDGPCAIEQPLYVGGPVSGPLVALHNVADLSESTVCPDVYVSMRKDHIQSLVARPQDRCRLFTGYAGWSKGQLEGELKAGGWFVLPAESDQIFAAHDDLWPQLMREIGDRLLAPILGRHRFPDDPSLN